MRAAKKKSPPPPSENTETLLLKAAEDVFSDKGFGGATVKEIADKAGVNISLISYHFGGKEGLLRACVLRFGKERLQDSETYLSKPENFDDFRVKLLLWTQQFLKCHVEDNNICNILHRENLAKNKFLWDIFESTFIKGFDAVATFFDAARKKGILKKSFDSRLAASMLFGSVIHLGKSQEIQEQWMGISIKDEKYRRQAAEQIVDTLIGGLS